MARKINYDRKLEKFESGLKKSLNLSGLFRLNPIFNSPEIFPFPNPPPGIAVNFPRVPEKIGIRKLIDDYTQGKISIQDAGLESLLNRLKTDSIQWIVWPSEKIAVSLQYDFVEQKPLVRHMLVKNTPIYLRGLIKPAFRAFPTSLITASDSLPLELSMVINLYSEGTKEYVLEHVASFLGVAHMQEIQEIIGDTKISLKEGLERILGLLKSLQDTRFSYCLTCGRRIDQARKFCDPTKYDEPKKHLNTFNYWLKARLGIKTVNGRERKRNELYHELQTLIAQSPLTAFERLKTKYPKLYTDRYKERWERERLLKK